MMVFEILVFISLFNHQTVHSQYLGKHELLRTTQNELIRNHINFNNQLSPEELLKIRSFLRSFGIGPSWNINRSYSKDPNLACRTSRTCYECYKDNWLNCGWCHDYGCTESPEKFCPLAQGKLSINNLTEEMNLCPYVDHEGPLVIASGIETNIKLKVRLFDPIVFDKEIICQIKLRNRLTHVKGKLFGNVLHCDPVTLYTTEYTDTDVGSLNIIWGGAHPYSNDIPVTVYKCEALAKECETCRLIPLEYGCGWCDDTESCVVSEKCDNNLLKWSLSKINCEALAMKMYYV